MKKIYCCLMLFIGMLAQGIHAAPTNPSFKTVYGLGKSDVTSENISQAYSGKIRYYYPPEWHNYRVSIPAAGSSPAFDITFNLGNIVDDAFTEWRGSSLFFHGPSFTYSNLDDDSVGISFVDVTTPRGSHLDDDNDGMTVFEYNATSQLVPPTTIHLNIHQEIIGLGNNYNYAVQSGYISSREVTMRDYFIMRLRITILHELGHAFGLTHPLLHDNHSDTSSNPSIETRTAITSAENYPNDGPSIMIDSNKDYIEQLFFRYERVLTPSDVRLSQSDIDAAYYMWRGRTYATQSSLSSLLSCGALVCGTHIAVSQAKCNRYDNNI